MLSVREINQSDIELIANYWLNSDTNFMQNMGVDMSKMPTLNQWNNFLSEQLTQAYTEKKSYCIIWELNGIAIGHSNINKIVFESEAYMHLHIWNSENRQKGYGEKLIKLTLPYFFKNFKIKKLYCEPYQLNASPNNTLKKLGFSLVKTYTTIPGWLNFEQVVNLWELDFESFKGLKKF